ncbi:MAG: hypothetical protein MPJ24_01570 [Pirellulaceae bacterium]|nr:hypothetical protein [Pirellulaceae bacterium]
MPKKRNIFLKTIFALSSIVFFSVPLLSQDQTGLIGRNIVDIQVIGNRRVPTVQVESFLKIRRNRPYQSQQVQESVRSLHGSNLFKDVRTMAQIVPGGVKVIFEVFEQPVLGHVRFVGNSGIKDSILHRQIDLKAGEAKDTFAVKEARRKLESFYHSKGYTEARVQVVEGNSPQDEGVAFMIYEGFVRYVYKVNFIGNTVVNDSRLKTIIQSGPKYMDYLSGGKKVEQNTIEQDTERLVAYYRSLGYFQARVGRELSYSDDGKWLTISFVISEGERYKIRNVVLVGNEIFSEKDILNRLELANGLFFNSEFLSKDIQTIQDYYGSKGYLFAQIQAEPLFLAEPGLLDVVYKVNEGQLCRVGEINVHIKGDIVHTQRRNILNRVSLRPGDIADIRKIRASERRIMASQLFQNGLDSGPKIEYTVPKMFQQFKK